MMSIEIKHPWEAQIIEETSDLIPRLSIADLPYGELPLHDRFTKLTDLFLRHNILAERDVAEFLKRAQDAEWAAAIVRETIRGGAEVIQKIQGLSEDSICVFQALAMNAIRPYLISLRSALASSAEIEEWRGERCPICGGEPMFATLDKEDRNRRLHCSVCAMSWTYPRLQCPFCENGNADTLQYFVLEDNPGPYRVDVCDSCKSYIKTKDLGISPGPAKFMLFLEDFLTIELDVAAENEEYMHGLSDCKGSANCCRRQ